MATVLLGEKKLPTFRGHHNENFRDFFDKFQAYADHFKIKEDEILTHFKAALKGNAAKIVKALVQENSKVPYAEVCVALKQFYCQPTQLSMARQKLYNAEKKRGESMHKYLFRLLDIVTSTEESEANTKELNDIIVKKLVYALPISIYRVMHSKEGLTPLTVIPEAMNLIREAPDEKECMRKITGGGGLRRKLFL